MKTISFKVSDEEYKKLKEIKDSTWNWFFVSGLSACPYCGKLFSTDVGKKLCYQQSHHCIISDPNFGDWPYIRKRKEQERKSQESNFRFDIDIIAVKNKKELNKNE